MIQKTEIDSNTKNKKPNEENDYFIKYHQITEKIIEDEEEIVDKHLNLVKVLIFIFKNQ